MNSSDLIGSVGALSLRERLSNLGKNEGVARFLLDRLTGVQVAAIVLAILDDVETSYLIRIKVPRLLVSGFELPEEVLTDKRTTWWRHAECDRLALLIANTDDDQLTSLQDVTLLGAKELTENPHLWVKAASRGLRLLDSQLMIWEAAIKGLTVAEDWTLHQLSNYVELTRYAIKEESKPLLDALGWALPALHLPRDSGLFLSLQDKDKLNSNRWKKQFEKLISDRRPLLTKQRSARQLIDSEELRVHFDNVKEEINPLAYPIIESFINSSPSWNIEAAELANLEWEIDGIVQLFSGLKQRKTNLAEETINFFDFDEPDRLSETEKNYLYNLKDAQARKSIKEPREDDKDFFETHREELGRNRLLRAKWERFIFGKPVECIDILNGLLRVIERLYGQAGHLSGPKRLEIRSVRRKKSQLLELNSDVALAFSLRCKGLPELMGRSVIWDADYLLNYEDLLEEAKNKKRYKKNISTSRISTQIKLDITLVIGLESNAERITTQLIWNGSTTRIGLELNDDLKRLEKRPFSRASISRQTVSRKGALQSVSLENVLTLQPAYRQESGSLIPKSESSSDIDKEIRKAIKLALEDNRITSLGCEIITETWDSFVRDYSEAIAQYRLKGASSLALIKQAESYADLLRSLSQHAQGDLNRQEIWQPILALGCVEIAGGPPSAIIAPWHPMRFASIAVKNRVIAGLIDYLLTSDEVNFGDSRLFFNDLRDELSHPYYPEIAIGYLGSEPVLLTETITVNDYSLMESPVRGQLDAASDVDPKDAANQIRLLVDRYLQFQPHEASNLSIMLYNCDASGLPLETINTIGSINEHEDLQCSALVRHRDRAKLNRVYGEVQEKFETDPDAHIVSETSPNFMSKLRIGVLVDGERNTLKDYRNIDVAFLHDVVSRQAKEAWFSIAAPIHNPSLLEHVPARWSYRRVRKDDQLKATNYLACPRQPTVGWSYLDAVAMVIRRETHEITEHYLPARQISFQDQQLREMFDEVHSLSEWVATYDDLLDKRQLAALGINVIRYRRRKTHGRNLIVSSTSEFRLLQVLVKRRLQELSLPISDDSLSDLSHKMIKDALIVSGDVVLRAAKSGVSAGELIGLALSRALIAEEFKNGSSVSWFLLDDYAEWLGQKEEGIADILGLCVERSQDKELRLRAIVTEAKYIRGELVGDARRSSKLQLTQTVRRIDDALFGDPGRLDRDLWLSRIADLLLDSTMTLGESSILEEVRDGLRQGSVAIDLRGYSHVFVSGLPGANTVISEQEKINEIQNGLQEVYGRDELKKLIKAYHDGEPLKPIRMLIGTDKPWEEFEFKKPAPRVVWTTKKDVSKDNTAADITIPSKPLNNNSVDPLPLQPTEKNIINPEIAILPNKYSVNLSNLVTLHAESESQILDADNVWLDNTADKLKAALLGYNLQARIVGKRLTPNAALIRFMGSDRLGIENIEAKRLALLTTHGLKIVGISPLPNEIVVAVARNERQTVSLWDIWSKRKINRNQAGMNTSFVMGLRELDGEILYLNLGSQFAGSQQHEPHTLIAGATGSGKSVLIQSIILDIAATNGSNLAKIILIDPKQGVDYSAVARLPHIQNGIIIEKEHAIETMENLVEEMDRRYKLFRIHGVRDLKSYNMKVNTSEYLPTIFLIHDEFAEWMLSSEYKDAIAENVQRLGVKARAAGIHLFFAAQRPDANVMPMQLRDNLGNRLILKVASVGTSEIALGVKGAESLLGLGHLAAKLNGEVIFAQAPYLSDEDIESAVDSIIGTAG